jgi:hypothetical protein
MNTSNIIDLPWNFSQYDIFYSDVLTMESFLDHSNDAKPTFRVTKRSKRIPTSTNQRRQKQNKQANMTIKQPL